MRVMISLMQPVGRLLGPVKAENVLRRLPHSGESAADELVGINDDIHPVGGQFFLGNGVEGGGHHHQRGIPVGSPEPVTER